MTETKKIHIDNLYDDPQQSRSNSDKRLTEDFLDSIKEYGIIHPLTVRPVPEDEEKSVSGKRGTEENPAGEQQYYIISGSRRYRAAVKTGCSYVDCIVNDVDDEEATALSLEENQERLDLTSWELAETIKKRFDALSEDLVGKDERVECPECGKKCDGRMGLNKHIEYKHNAGTHDDSSGVFTSKRQIYEQIADSSSFDWRTVERLVQVAKTPEPFHLLHKTPEERSRRENKKINEYTSSNFTFATEQSIVSQKSIDFARFTDNHPERLIELTLERKKLDQKTDKLNKLWNNISELYDAWSGHFEEKDDGVADDVVYSKAASEKPLPSKEEENKENDSKEQKTVDDEQNNEEKEDETKRDSKSSDEKDENIDDENKEKDGLNSGSSNAQSETEDNNESDEDKEEDEEGAEEKEDEDNFDEETVEITIEIPKDLYKDIQKTAEKQKVSTKEILVERLETE